MASGKDGSSDFYAVLGLKRDCSAKELRNAYKMLALKWHPDRCSASGNSKFVEEAKKKFQAIHEAYSVLSDANQRFLYDVGANESSDDETGMEDFLEEMAAMMSQNKQSEESLEELQELLEEMLEGDMNGGIRTSSSHQSSKIHRHYQPSSSNISRSTFSSSSSSSKAKGDSTGGGRSSGKRRESKASSRHDVSA